MATPQPMVCLLVASCLVLLGGSEAQYSRYYHAGYASYPYRAYPSYPYGGWPLKHVHGVHLPVHSRPPVLYQPVPHHPYAPKLDGLHQLYPHVILPRPVPQPQFNVYNIFDGGITKQSATSHAGANSPAGGGSSGESSQQVASGASSQEAASGESWSSQEATSSSREAPLSASASGEQWASPAPSAPVEAPKLPSAHVDDRHANPKQVAAPKTFVAVKHVDSNRPTHAPAYHTPKLHLTFREPHKAPLASPSHGAKKHVPAAPAFTNHGWFPHKAVHV